MQHRRSRRGNSFQERDSEGRFTSPERYNGGYNRGYGNGGYSDADRGGWQFGNQDDYGYEDDYADYPQGRNRGYNQQDDFRNENEDRYENRYNDYEERERGYNGGGYNDRDYDYNYDQRQRAYRPRSAERGYSNSMRDDFDERGYNQGGYDDYRHRGQGGDDRWDWGYERSNHVGDRYQREGNGNSRRSTGHRGFETMPRSEVRRIAAMGGRASHGGSSQSGRSNSRGGRVSNRRRSRSSR